MVNKKVCMLGSFAVGKTALVQQYVHSIFSDRYLSTVGVKISKKQLMLGGQEITMVLWDLEGKDDYVDVNISYLRGAMGFLSVVDGCRKETFETALALRTLAMDLIGPAPNILLINKADLESRWEVGEEDIDAVVRSGVKVLKTSAKTGLGVDEAFTFLAGEML